MADYTIKFVSNGTVEADTLEQARLRAEEIARTAAIEHSAYFDNLPYAATSSFFLTVETVEEQGKE